MRTLPRDCEKKEQQITHIMVGMAKHLVKKRKSEQYDVDKTAQYAHADEKIRKRKQLKM